MLYSPAFFAMAFANLCTGSSFSSFALFPLFISEHGGNAADIGIIMGVLSLSSVISRPWISEMIDRIGRKRSFTIGCFIMTVLPLAYMRFRGDLHGFYLLLLVARIVQGVGFAFCMTAAFTYAVDIIPKHRLNEGIGIFGISGLMGMALGPVVAEITIRSYGFQGFFPVASGLALVGLIGHLPVRETLSRHVRPDSASFMEVLCRHRIVTVGLLAFLFGFGIAGSSNFVAPYASERHVPYISLYFIVYSVAAVLARLIGGKFADRVGEVRIVPFAMAITGAGLLVMLALYGSFFLCTSGFLTGFGHGFLFPSLSAMAIRDEPFHVRGKITGIFTGSIDAGVFVGSIILGYVGEFAGFKALFLCAGLALLSGVLVLEVRGRQ